MPTQKLLWRALMRIVLSLPRQLHDDMVRGTGLTASPRTLSDHTVTAHQALLWRRVQPRYVRAEQMGHVETS
jgi:hypothetical protein